MAIKIATFEHVLMFIILLTGCNQHKSAANTDKSLRYEKYISTFNDKGEKISSRFYYFHVLLPYGKINEKFEQTRYFDVQDVLCRQPEELNFLSLAGQVLRAKRIRRVDLEVADEYRNNRIYQNPFPKDDQCVYRYETESPIKIGGVAALPLDFKISDYKTFKYTERPSKADDVILFENSKNRKVFYPERSFKLESAEAKVNSLEGITRALKNSAGLCKTLESELAYKVICQYLPGIDTTTNYCWKSKKLGFYCGDKSTAWHSYDKRLHKQYKGPFASIKINDHYYEVNLLNGYDDNHFVFDSENEFVSFLQSDSRYSLYKQTSYHILLRSTL